MKHLAKFSILLLFVLALQACEEEKSSLCFTPPEPFTFEFVDKTTGENVFTNGTYTVYNISMVNTLSDDNVFWEFIDENDQNLVVINSIGWKTEKVNVSIFLKDKHILDLYVDAERVNDECSYTKYNEIHIDDAEYEYVDSLGLYKVYIDTP